MDSAYVIARRLVILLTVLLLSANPIAAEGPENAPPTIHKLTINNNGARVVHYSTTSESPHLQALCRILQWAENEVTIVEELQQLKVEAVVNERRLASLRATQQLSPGIYPGSYNPGACYQSAESALSVSLAGVLADEATPERAIQLIQLLEKAQTDLADELKKMAPKDRLNLEVDSKVLDKAVVLLRSKRDASARHAAASANGTSSSSQPAAPANRATPYLELMGPPTQPQLRFVLPTFKQVQAALAPPIPVRRPPG